MIPSKPKVLLAMSGGVDSSVAAALLLREGYDVVGVFMRLGTPGETLDEPVVAQAACAAGAPDGPGSAEELDSMGHDSPGGMRRGSISTTTFPLKIRHQGCCSISDAADARLVAAELEIPLYVCNFKKDFGRIIDYFASEYARGRTPNPCVRCNDWLKFGKLHDYARQLGAQFVASGHYARVVNDATPPPPSLRRFVAPSLLQAIDHTKDQSYVLFGAPRERLNEMLLPVGGYHKSQIRDLAQKLGLPVFDKPDSQEICFVPDNDYASLVERMNEDAARAHEHGGDILDADGAVVGAHAGQHRYTIGQRRGIGVAAGRPIYVIDKDPIANTITVGDREDLLVSSCTATEINLLVNEERFAGFKPCLAKYRYNADPVLARARLVTTSFNGVDAPCGERSQSESKAALEVRFDAPQPAVAPGQAVVLYGSPDAGDDPDLVLGGGWIETAHRDAILAGDQAGRSAHPVLRRGPVDPNTV